MSTTDETTNVIDEAVKVINNFSDLHWVDANEAWGREGVKHSEVRFLEDRKKVTRKRRNRKTGQTDEITRWTGGFKDWSWDIKRAWRHTLKAVSLAPFKKTMLHDNRRSHLYTAWWSLRYNNNLNRPDGKVSGTTLYGVWVEEAWHAAIWSPVVALAVKDLLIAYPDSPEAVKVAELLIQQRKRLSDNE